MSESSIEALDLAALLCSRVCHDLISPVGAIVNGLEVLEEEKDETTKEFALDLIKSSAATASKKLQFCRIAFGAAGSAGAQIDLGDAETISRGFLEDEKTKLAWNLPRVLLQKNRVKLLLNMILSLASLAWTIVDARWVLTGVGLGLYLAWNMLMILILAMILKQSGKFSST